MKNIVLTGATGYLGAQLLGALAKQSQVENIYLLDSGREGNDVLLKLNANSGHRTHRGNGFVSLQESTLQPADISKMMGVIDTAFDCELAGALECEFPKVLYVDPLTRWRRWLKHNSTLRLCFLSTTCVVGRRRGLFTEFDLECGQSFHNDWERACYNAERQLRASEFAGRTTIFRPSLTVGDSHTGAIYKFSPFYEVLRLFRGPRNLISGDPKARIDIVPVDYVAEAVLAIAAEPGSEGKTYHLISGWEQSKSLRDFVELVRAHDQSDGNHIRIVPPIARPFARAINRLNWGASMPHSNSLSSRLQGCLTHPAVFDNYMARAVLDAKGISCPPIHVYLSWIINFAETRHWRSEAAEPKVMAEQQTKMAVR
ncbi:MAG TPA: SDR family oxidoreductase [Candidatus Angelobacter sp.]|nr:SDR family oxidoreductase [Candidatus Angelobacter sp.]